MSKDNYQNFIYLFNNPNNVGIVSLNSSNRKVFSTFLNPEETLESLSEGQFQNYQVFSSDTTVDDSPIQQISSQRRKQKNTSTNSIQSADTKNLQTNVVINSNDPGFNPNMISVFKIEGGTAGSTSKISFAHEQLAFFNQATLSGKKRDGTPYYKFTMNSAANFSNQKSRQGKKYIDYVELTSKNSNEAIDPSNLVKKQNFVYTHYKHLELHNFNAASFASSYAGSDLKEKVNDFFLNYYIISSNNSSDLGNKNLDISCKIGVPYDFQTVLSEKVNEKSLGISIKQPNYEKIYNYYDPQYEPLAIKLIDSYVLDEKTLPSIYDFLYLDGQQNILKSIIGLPGFGVDLDKVNLTNINQYLDKFAKVYSNFLKNVGNQSTLESAFLEKVAPYIKPISADILDPSIPVAKYNEKNPNNFLPSKIQKEVKSCFMKSLQSKDSGIDGYLVEISPLIEDKKISLPKWIDNVKTGIYFKENSLDKFNGALDQDDAFPFLIKINIPVEHKGPISSLFSKYGFLDAINSYAASINIPTEEVDQEGEFFVSSYDTFFGGVINGYSGKNYNLFYNVEFPSFKIFLRDAPKTLIQTKSVPSPGQALANQKSVKSSNNGVGFGKKEDAPFLNLPKPETEEDTTNVPSLVSITNPVESTSDIYLNTFEAIGDKAYNRVFIYDSKEKSNLPTPLASLIDKLKLEKFKEELSNLLHGKKLFRTPSEIHNGKMAYQETIMYEIVKYKIDVIGDQQYVQSIFLPINEKDNLSYYDTQVIPYQDYFYKIFAYKVVVGTEYSIAPYSNSEVVNFNENSGEIIMSYDVEPFLQIVRVPYYNTRHVNIKEDKLNHSRVEDSPPLAPQVNFVPFRNVDNKLMMLFNNTIGQTIQYPKIILPDDKTSFENVYLAQDRNPGSELLFKSDDSIGTFQIFRTDNLPMSYKDVNSDDTLKFVEIGQPTETDMSMNTSFIDDIVPNRDYYYFFRFVDIHKKVSNPTVIYKVIMRKQADVLPYLEIEVVDLEEKRKQQYDSDFTSTKTLQKYLFVDLTDSQKQPDYKNLVIDAEDPDQPSFYGSYSSVEVSYNNDDKKSQSVFGKRFKFRLTSKQTGKKIDVNLKVKAPEVKLNN